MDMGLDREGWLPAPVGSHAGGRVAWQGLHARLAAAYAARRVFERAKDIRPIVGGGSFHHRSARMLAIYGKCRTAGLSGINPTALANGKPVQDNDAAVAGAHPASD